MGYRSTFTTTDMPLDNGFPAWFVEKWGGNVHFLEGNNGKLNFPISAKWEMKCYGFWVGLMEDIQRVIAEDSKDDWVSVHFVWLHEDGLTEVHKISASAITPPPAFPAKTQGGKP